MKKSLTQLPQWQALKFHHESMRYHSLNNLFADNINRRQQFRLSAAGLYLDYSKSHVNSKTMYLLADLAKACEVPQKIQALLQGKIVNESEKNPALHTALRNLSGCPIYVNNQNVMPCIQDTLGRMKTIVEQVQTCQYLGYSGKPIKEVVNVGVGGSHWGPLLIYQALKTDKSSIRCHFITNLDKAAFLNVTRDLNPETTLFIITSKSFTTPETITNFHHVKTWLSEKISPALFPHHLIAVTAEIEKAKALGFSDKNIFSLWPWVGGRYSIWSSVGLSAAMAIGWQRFYEFLAGAEVMDQHFREADLLNNMPVVLALLSTWYSNFFNFQNHAIIPYSQNLSVLPDYLQQLHMESLGKHCQQDGRLVDYSTGTVIFGGVGTDSQHSFHQFFFQGATPVSIDFILPLKNSESEDYQFSLIANCIAQTNALMQGYPRQQVYDDLITQKIDANRIKSLVPHKIIPGNRPSNTLILEKLTSRHLGALLALYEHKVFIQSVIWNINAFDQWSVERGKKLSGELLANLESHQATNTSETSLIQWISEMNH